MERMTEISLAILATLGFIGWLGGGRKWAFRSMLSAVVLAGLGFAGILLYSYGTERATEHRTQTIRDCAIAKVARAACVPGGAGALVEYLSSLCSFGQSHRATRDCRNRRC